MRVPRPRLVVYVAGPFRGPDAWRVEQNVRKAEEASFILVEAGATPLCPHTMFRHFDKALPDEVWLEVSSDLLRRCDAVWVLEGWESSSGTKDEIELAGRLGMPVVYPRWAELWKKERVVEIVESLHLQVDQRCP